MDRIKRNELIVDKGFFIMFLFFGILFLISGIYIIYAKRKNSKKYNFIKTTGTVVDNDFQITDSLTEDECCYYPKIQYYVNEKKYINYLKNPVNVKINYNNGKPFRLSKNIEIMYSKTDPSIIILSKTYSEIILIGLSVFWVLIDFLVFYKYNNILRHLIGFAGIISLILILIPEIKAHSNKYKETTGKFSRLLYYDVNGSNSFRKVISFVVDNKKYYCLSNAATNPVFKAKKCIIKYNPENPYDCVLKHEFARIAGIILLTFFLILLFII